ncbi:MAG: biopolymer transporter ExbD [Planctomycetaceae bacterium]|nr:biopolymer transporter ExbD [Planctomycetaceae bacterium]
MAAPLDLNLPSGSLDDDPLLPPRLRRGDARFDVTAMIDLVFMLNIFFLVTTVGASLAEIDLPAARHCAPADRDTCVVLTITGGGDRGPTLLYVDDGPTGEPLSDPAIQERRTREAVEAGVRAKRMTVLIRAEKSVRLRDVARIGGVAVAVPGTDLKVSVIEKE